MSGEMFLWNIFHPLQSLNICFVHPAHYKGAPFIPISLRHSEKPLSIIYPSNFSQIIPCPLPQIMPPSFKITYRIQ